jgi:hypothetical protein
MQSDTGIPSRLPRILLSLLVFLFLLSIAAVCVTYAVNFCTLRQADSFVREVQGVELNRSTTEDVQRILARTRRPVSHSVLNLCDVNDDEYSVRAANPILNWLSERVETVRPFKNRDWAVTASIVVSHGRACAVRINVFALPEHGFISATASYEPNFPSPTSTPDPYAVSIRKYKGDDWLAVKVTSSAADLQRQNAFGFDFTCLRRFGGCQSACELLPSAWADYRIKARQEGWAVPVDEAADVRCNETH